MKDSKIIKSYSILGATGGNANVVEVDITYQLGGHNYFTGDNEPRGLYLGCSPVGRGDGWKSFTAFSGTKVHVLGMKRFSKKTLAEYIPTDEDIKKLVDHVVAKNNIQINLESTV